MLTAINCYVNLIFFSLTIINFVSICDSQYKFVHENIEFAYPTEPSKTEESKSLADLVNLIEPQKLCDQAKEYASADNADPLEIPMWLGNYTVYYSNGSSNKDQIVLRCSTTPRLYLRLPRDTAQMSEQIVVMERKNEYLMETSPYTFTAETVQFIWRTSMAEQRIYNNLIRDMISTKSMDEELQSNYLAKTTMYERLKMCIAAKIRLPEKRIEMLPDEYVEKAAKYEIVYQNGPRENVIAFACNSHPKIHIRMVDEYLKKQIVVMTATVSSS